MLSLPAFLASAASTLSVTRLEKYAGYATVTPNSVTPHGYAGYATVTPNSVTPLGYATYGYAGYDKHRYAT